MECWSLEIFPTWSASGFASRQYCRELDIDLVVEHWNTHSIRSSRYNSVAGKPDVLYYLPENSGGVNSGVLISNEEIQEVQHHCEREEDENEYEEYFHYVMETERLYYPNSPEESLALYGRLLEIAQ